MPKRTDIKSILIIGAGPIVIGQACEFDYSGAQACKALRAEGYRVILVNSNPATIMTDPEMADVTYVEPVTWQVVDALKAVSVVSDHAQALYRESQIVLRAAVGGRTIDALLADKETVGAEVRNALAAIQNSLYLLGEGPAAGRVRAVSEREIRGLSGLMDGLLEVSQLALGRVRPNPAPVHLLRVIARPEVTAAAKSPAISGSIRRPDSVGLAP